MILRRKTNKAIGSLKRPTKCQVSARLIETEELPTAKIRNAYLDVRLAKRVLHVCLS